MKDMKVGDVREWNETIIKAELGYSCQECAFFQYEDCKEMVKNKLGHCEKSDREIERDEIIFREIR